MAETDFEEQTFPWKNEQCQTILIPALDSRWCDESRDFPLYFGLKSMEKLMVDAWISNMSTLIQQCKWLLKLPHHVFWSFVVYGNKSLHAMLDSYLIKCPRPTEPLLMHQTFFSTRGKIVDLQTTLHRRIFFIFLRMSSRREAGTAMSVQYFGQLIYDNFLFDIPRLADLAALYGGDNERTLQKMFEHIFKCQPKYYGNIKDSCEALLTMFEKCEQSVNSRLGEKVQLLSRPSRYDQRASFDSVYFLIDVVYALTCFAKFCPQSVLILHKNGLTKRIPSFFENTMPPLFEAIAVQDVARFNDDRDMVGRLAFFEKMLTEFFRMLIYENSLKYLNGEKSDESQSNKEYLEEFLEMLTVVLHEKSFAVVYNSTFSVVDDLNKLMDNNIHIDHERFVYLCEAFSDVAAVSSKVEQNGTHHRRNVPSPSTMQPEVGNFDYDSARMANVQAILDIFPDYNIDYIQKLLTFFNNNVQNVVDGVLTESLPRELILTTEKEEPAGAVASLKQISEVLSDEAMFTDRSKQTDDDEESQDYWVPLASSKKRGLKESLEDKVSVKDARAIYERFQFETPDEDEENESENNQIAGDVEELQKVSVYDDEYDDTYDGHNVNVESDALPDEVIASYYKRSKSNTEEAEGEEDQGSSSEVKNAVRPWRGNYTGGRDRQFKERHKAHNRKDQSLYKHSRGFGFF